MTSVITCLKCKKEKPLKDFSKDKNKANGLKTRCKSCISEYYKEYYHRDPQKHVKRACDRNRKSKYGLTPQAYKDLLLSQEHRCAICKTHLDESSFSKIGQVDHCHKKNFVRGVLCSQCNTSLGGFKDNIAILYNAIQYLEKYKDD